MRFIGDLYPRIYEIFGRAGGYSTKLTRALHNSEMTTGGHTDYPRASVRYFDMWLRAHKSQPLSKGLTIFLDFFPWLLLNHRDKSACFHCNQSPSADLLSLGTGVSSGCTSATLHYYLETPRTSAKTCISPGSYHPSNLPVQWLIWTLPPLLCLKQWLFANKTIRPHVCEGVRSTHVSTR